jgi:hypothetical protein
MGGTYAVYSDCDEDVCDDGFAVLWVWIFFHAHYDVVVSLCGFLYVRSVLFRFEDGWGCFGRAGKDVRRTASLGLRGL